jgi:hypothetical protein
MCTPVFADSPVCRWVCSRQREENRKINQPVRIKVSKTMPINQD